MKNKKGRLQDPILWKKLNDILRTKKLLESARLRDQVEFVNEFGSLEQPDNFSNTSQWDKDS